MSSSSHPKKSPRKLRFHPLAVVDSYSESLTPSLKHLFNLAFQPSRKPSSQLINATSSCDASEASEPITSLASQIESISSNQFRVASYLLLGLNLLHRFKIVQLERQLDRFKKYDVTMQRANMMAFIGGESHDLSSKEQGAQTLKSNQQLNMQLEDMTSTSTSADIDPSMLLLQRDLPPLIQFRLQEATPEGHTDDGSHPPDHTLLAPKSESLRLFQQFVEHELREWHECETPLPGGSASNFYGTFSAAIAASFDRDRVRSNPFSRLGLESPEGARRTSLPTVVDLPPIDLFNDDDFGMGLTGGDLLRKSPRGPLDTSLEFANDSPPPIMDQDDTEPTENKTILKRKRRSAIIDSSQTEIDNRLFATWLKDSRSIKRRRISLTEEVNTFRGGVVKLNAPLLAKSILQTPPVSLPPDHSLSEFFMSAAGIDLTPARTHQQMGPPGAIDDFPHGTSSSPTFMPGDLSPLFLRADESFNPPPPPTQGHFSTETQDDDAERLRIRTALLSLLEVQGEVSFFPTLTQMSCESKLEASRAFYQLLVLKSEDRVDVLQETPFGEILVSHMDKGADRDDFEAQTKGDERRVHRQEERFKSGMA